eukprot:68069-Rhodomonas_salina.1
MNKKTEKKGSSGNVNGRAWGAWGSYRIVLEERSRTSMQAVQLLVAAYLAAVDKNAPNAGTRQHIPGTNCRETAEELTYPAARFALTRSHPSAMSWRARGERGGRVRRRKEGREGESEGRER